VAFFDNLLPTMGWFITVELQKQTSARHSTQGTALWLKTSIPF
jgi:hypothetical protein